jgi:hypothetical protein
VAVTALSTLALVLFVQQTKQVQFKDVLRLLEVLTQALCFWTPTLSEPFAMALEYASPFVNVTLGCSDLVIQVGHPPENSVFGRALPACSQQCS